MAETVPETPVEDMSVDELREEYTQYDIHSMEVGSPKWDRHLDIWRELESRDLVEFPACKECGNQRWRFEIGGPPTCADCGWPPETAEYEERIHDASMALIHGGDS